MKIYLAQINNRVGDFDYNFKRITDEIAKAKGVDLVVFCEMAICGYPCQDLWLRPGFIEKSQQYLRQVAQKCQDFDGTILLGAPRLNDDGALMNSMFLLEKGEVRAVFDKKNLPNFGVFDENRYFKASNRLKSFVLGDKRVAVLVCEDFWDAKNAFLLAERDFDAIVVANSSPFEVGKFEKRLEVAKKLVSTLKKPLIYVNQVGGQDELVFDGKSFAMDENGDLEICLRGFEEDAAVFDVAAGQNAVKNPENEAYKDIFAACELGLGDYFVKSGFEKAILGLSGGVDSALVLVLAVRALGAENVRAYALPTRFNSDESMRDALDLAQNLGVELEVIAIEEQFQAMIKGLEGQKLSDLALENMQSRIRGNILMALSNSGRGLLLSTGNKSELAVGYATIYGDMCGAFNPIKDLYKTQIYGLCEWYNANFEAKIPQNILTKEPTAELREGQKDSDSLPEYEILDKILFLLIEKKKSLENIINMGYNEVLVRKIANLVFAAEYKRRQAAMGVKLSGMSFDKDWRYPVACKIYQ